MNFSNRNFVRGLFLIVFALVFGIAAARYPLGTFARSGPGMFPLLISCCLLLVGIATVLRSRLVAPVPLDYNFKNILIIMVSLCGFVIVSHFLNMLIGIVFLVFCSTLAGTSYSWVRNVKISLGLIAVAFAFKHLLGLSLPIL